MMPCFVQLPQELKECIYSFCKLCDLRNVACCSKASYMSVQYIIWHCVEIPWRSFGNMILPWKIARKKLIRSRRLSNLKFTNYLRFREDWCGSLTGEKRWTRVANHYKKIIENCNPNRLVTIYIDRVIVDQGLIWTCHLLYMLQEIYLNCCYHITDHGWQHLTTLKQLRKLSLRNCEIRDSSIKKMLGIKQLKEFRLDQCLQVTCTGLKLISTLTQLEKLTFSYNWHIEANVYQYFSRLHKLVDLDLRYTNISDCMLECITKTMMNLKGLNLRGCHNISDAGLAHLTILLCLEELDVSECSKVTVVGLSQITTMVMLSKLIINRRRTLIMID